MIIVSLELLGMDIAMGIYGGTVEHGKYSVTGELFRVICKGSTRSDSRK